MSETLVNAYLPLIVWTGLGMLVFRFMPTGFPRLLGRALYWVGVPWEIFSLARQTKLPQQVGLAPVITVASLLLALMLAQLSFQGYQRWLTQRQLKGKNCRDSATFGAGSWTCIDDRLLPPVADRNPFDLPEPLTFAGLNRAQQGSFVLASMLGNTGFVGLGLVPALVPDPDIGWAVFYSVTQNVVGTYGLGVLLASYYGRSHQNQAWWAPLKDVLTVPSLWAFGLGTLTRPLTFPPMLELGLHASLWFVIPAAFLLMGMRLSQLRNVSSLHFALIPSVLKIFVLPAMVGLGVTFLGLTGDSRLALVLMAGMPSAFAGLILSEEYELDRELMAGSIALSTVALLITVPLWIVIFR